MRELKHEAAFGFAGVLAPDLQAVSHVCLASDHVCFNFGLLRDGISPELLQFLQNPSVRKVTWGSAWKPIVTRLKKLHPFDPFALKGSFDDLQQLQAATACTKLRSLDLDSLCANVDSTTTGKPGGVYLARSGEPSEPLALTPTDPLDAAGAESHAVNLAWQSLQLHRGLLRKQRQLSAFLNDKLSASSPRYQYRYSPLRDEPFARASALRVTTPADGRNPQLVRSPVASSSDTASVSDALQRSGAATVPPKLAASKPLLQSPSNSKAVAQKFSESLSRVWRLSDDALHTQPRWSFQGQTLVVSERSQVAAAVRLLRETSDGLLGFDTELKPRFSSAAPESSTGVLQVRLSDKTSKSSDCRMQVCSASVAVLFRPVLLGGLPREVASLLLDPALVKVCQAMRADVERLRKEFPKVSVTAILSAGSAFLDLGADLVVLCSLVSLRACVAVAGAERAGSGSASVSAAGGRDASSLFG